MPPVVAELRVVHEARGRLRVHLRSWSGAGAARLERELLGLRGVTAVRASPATGNVLVCFDVERIDRETVMERLRGLRLPRARAAPPVERTRERPRSTPLPHVLHERRGHRRRVRITVRGLDRDHRLGARVVRELEAIPGVERAVASPLTGRVLVDYSEHLVDVEDLVAEVTGLELPGLPGEDRPAHPLDPAPLTVSAVRTVGGALGLALVAVRGLAGAEGPPVRAGAAEVAAAVGVVEGAPAIREQLQRLLGRNRAEVSLSVLGVAALALSGSSLGLATSAAGALRVLTEVRARRAAWRRYEGLLESAPAAVAGAEIRLDSGARVPLSGRIVEGTGTALAPDGLPVPVRPEGLVPGGARVFGGPFVVELGGERAFTPAPRPTSIPPSPLDRYVGLMGPVSLGYAALTAVLTRSWRRTFVALVLVNPRPALIGAQAADAGASARALRSGVIVVGSRPDRPIALPDVVVLDNPRVLGDGLELKQVLPVDGALTRVEVEGLAAGIAGAASLPWGRVFSEGTRADVVDGHFDGRRATATAGDRRYALAPATPRQLEASAADEPGAHWLALTEHGHARPLGLIALVPRLAEGVGDLVDGCRRHGVKLVLRRHSERVSARAIAERAGIGELVAGNSADIVREHQRRGERVAFVSDSARAGDAFAVCDLAIALTSGRSGHFPARADLLTPDLTALAAVIESAARRRAAIRDATAMSVLANAIGVVWGLRGSPEIAGATNATYITALGAIADAWLRQRGGRRSLSVLTRLVDPRPERWGRQSRAAVIRALDSRHDGLSTEQAARRVHELPAAASENGFVTALADQIRSPLTGLLAGGAAVSLLFGATADVALIGAVILTNAAVGAWQEHAAGEAAQALERLGAASAQVQRDGSPRTIPAREVVTGDVLLLASGDRVAADARLLHCEGLEVDESALTGESIPVRKVASGGTDASRIVLAGTDVTVGTARAVAVAVGKDTRMGALGAALAHEANGQTPLGQRLSLMLRQGIPIIAASGALITVSGLLWGRPLLPQLALGASAAVAALPEGLPLLAGAAEAAVARRLASRNVLVRRLSAVEALGRVDIACCDKTGTMTDGRLALSLVASLEQEATMPARLGPELADVLLVGALATPHPEASDAGVHPTDVAVVRAAEQHGLTLDLEQTRERESPFDPARSYHAALVGGRLCLKGAAEVLLPRCTRERRDGHDAPLNASGRRRLLEQARRLAERGLRVLIVAEGPPDGVLEDPQELVAVGYLGISDPLRSGVADAVHRCQEAGVRLVMLTGDHPATAYAIARQAGLPATDDQVLTGTEIAELDDAMLDRSLERAAVVARITPLDKLRIVESLQRRGHTVAMTGDGVNDAPALRLADVGVAMGRGGTEVARQAADVVLADDDFSTLVEALVEGRAFWQNIRRALGLLLGGNLGELGLMAGAGVLGRDAPLTTRQILTINLVTDVLPALGVAVQQPEHRTLAALAREGTAGLGTPLRDDILRRAAATGVPSLAAYLVATRAGGPAQGRAVAFVSIVATQLAQMLAVGHAQGQLTPPVLGAAAICGGVVFASVALPPVNGVLELTRPTPTSWAITAAAAAGALIIGRVLAPAGNESQPIWPDTTSLQADQTIAT
jgi:cation-transporting ATPase I